MKLMESIALVVLAVFVLFKYGGQFQQAEPSRDFERPSMSMVTKVNGIDVKLRGNPDAERIAYLFLHSASIADDAGSFANLHSALATLTKGLENTGGTHAPGIRADVDRLFRDHVGTEGQLDSSARSRWREACGAVAWAAHRASQSGGFFQSPSQIKMPRIEWGQNDRFESDSLVAYSENRQFDDEDDYDWRRFTGSGMRQPSKDHSAEIPNFRDLKNQKKKRVRDTSLIR